MRGSALPQLLLTERPPCDSGTRGFENRVFECGKCYTMKAVPAAIDRMKSPSAKLAESPLLTSPK